MGFAAVASLYVFRAVCRLCPGMGGVRAGAFMGGALGVALAALATAAALVLPIHSLEPFLLLLSSIFVPLFGVVLSQLALGALPARAGVRWGPALLWLAGIACFHLGGLYWPQWGSALPCLAFTLMGGLLVRALAPGPQTPPVGAR